MGDKSTKIRESEASQKLQAQMEANKIASATELTAKAIDAAIIDINTNNDVIKTTTPYTAVGKASRSPKTTGS